MPCMVNLTRVCIILLLNFVAAILKGKASRSSLTLKNNCICPGYTLIFAECTVDGGPGDSTVWKGSAFDCSSNDIPLVHSRFASSPKAAGECNNGSVEAHGLRVQDNCYTSQLNISVTPNLIGKTIKCVHDNLTAEIVVGTLRVTTVDPLPPPNTLFISKADFISRQITFRWSQAVIECTDLDVRYNILASNCGSCPTTTNHTSVTCTDMPINGGMCTFALQTVICGYITGNESAAIFLRGLAQNLGATCTGAIASASLLAIMLLIISCGSISTNIFLVLRKYNKRLPSNSMKQLPESNYDMVNYPQSSSGSINTEKNVAYGQVHT